MEESSEEEAEHDTLLEQEEDDFGDDDDNNNNDDNDNDNDDSDNVEQQRTGFLKTFRKGQNQRRGLLLSKTTRDILDDDEAQASNWLYRTLLPDTGLSIRGHTIIEASGAATKLLKFIFWTFVSIALVHVVVAHLFDDRDKLLKLAHIWRYESDLIVRDCLVFFVVGRMWEKPGIDHAAWMLTAFLANFYFESQNFVWFLQHSVTLFQMHCLWPWELWVFALVLVVAATGLVAAHALKAWRDRLLVAKLTEVGLCVLFFMAPVITSDYFHLHHWYAGWLMGMQFNYNTW